jgi:hypothetical protein
VWGRLQDPTYFEIAQFQHAANGPLVATIPMDITGEPPAAASIRMTSHRPGR